ncbi:MAG: hypothetical protein QOH76_2000 [Thermoleophilaceae bacterium]|jgi:hypothetical protein|nr:hypothetical protein [Thermoleophilaceae bacterium]
MAAGDDDILAAQVRVPEHVVYREFQDETVILNLDSGNYHGLNATAAKMVETLGSAARVSDAIDSLAAEFQQPREVIERDVVALCRSLEERGLIVRDAGDVS